MTSATRKHIVLGGVGIAVLTLLVFAFLPEPIPVETVVVVRAALEVTIEEEGETAAVERYAVTAPVSGFLRRVNLDPGDTVSLGQVVATLGPPSPAIVGTEERAEAAARVRAAQATARAVAAERARVEQLAASGSATAQALERAVGEADRAAAELAAAEAALRRAEGAADPTGGRVLRAPVAGNVLAVRRVSEGPVGPGDTLLVIADAGALEVDVDVRSEDAVRIPRGGRVLIGGWGGDAELEAVVDRVEPQGFTTISSLGVEEQRVTVVVTPVSPDVWGLLGPGYRVVARFVVWEEDGVLQVPSSALFRVAETWSAFVVEGGRARLRTVEVGREAGLVSQVIGGLEVGEVVIVHPSNEVADGVRVASREE